MCASFLQACVTSVFCCYCLNVTAHLDILRDIVENSDLQDFVTYHFKIIKLAQKLNNLFRPIVLNEFIIITIFLCFTGVQIIKCDNLIIILAAFLHCTAGVVDMTVYAYGGQRISDKSVAVCNQMYIISRKYVPVIMMSQKEINFDGLFFKASMETLSVTLGRAVSFITLLKSFVK